MSFRKGEVRLWLLRMFRVIDLVAVRSCQVAVTVMALFILAQVVLRYVFRSPFVWAEEASIFLMIWMTFVGAGAAIRRRANVAMTLLVDRLPAKFSRWVFVVCSLAILGFLATVAWKGWFLSMSAEDQRTPALGVSMVWPYLIIPLGMILMICQVVATILDPKAGQSSRQKRPD